MKMTQLHKGRLNYIMERSQQGKAFKLTLLIKLISANFGEVV